MTLIAQEPPLDHPDSCNYFCSSDEKPFLATTGAIEKYTYATVFDCLLVLRQKAEEHGGIDYLQVFEDANGDRLWVIEDGGGGAITALLPEEY